MEKLFHRLRQVRCKLLTDSKFENKLRDGQEKVMVDIEDNVSGTM